MSFKDVTVVVRSAGERTVELCVDLICEQGVDSGSIIVLEKAPFSDALSECYKIGMRSGKAWLLCVDADVLVRPGGLGRLLGFAGKQPKKVCEIHTHVLDKLFGGPRMGGLHLYRTEWLPLVSEQLEHCMSLIRPEAKTLEAMAQLGYPWVECPYVVGLHDFEQHRKDIARKTLVHAHKHQRLLPFFLGYWRKEAQAGDADFTVALAGLSVGVGESGVVQSNVRMLRKSIEAVLEGIEEKGPLGLGDWDAKAVETLITGWREPEGFREVFPWALGCENKVYSKKLFFLGNELKRAGTLGGLGILLGRALEVFGRRLRVWVERRGGRY